MDIDYLHGYARLELTEGKGKMAYQGLEATLRDAFFQIVAPAGQNLDAERDKGLLRFAVVYIIVSGSIIFPLVLYSVLGY